LFRLRKFEEEWIAPLTDGPESRDPLNVLLLAEAQAWVSVGQSIGYFASRETNVPAMPSLEPEIAPIVDRIQASLSPLPHLSADDFSLELSDAREDLTTERRIMLQRVLFSEESEWVQALTSLERLVLLLGDGVDITSADLAGLAWALEAEVVLQDDDKTRIAVSLPAGWRTGELSELASLLPHTAGRIEALQRARREIARMLADRHPRNSTELVLADTSEMVHDINETLHAHARAVLRDRWLASGSETTPERLHAFGTASAVPYLHRHEWIHRAVEKIVCSSDNELTILRRIRLDLTIPPGLEPVNPLVVSGGGAPDFYVPVSLISKTMSTTNLELHSASGESLPVLTRRQSGVIDLAMLLALARRSAGDREVPDELAGMLEIVVGGAPDEAAIALGYVLSRQERMSAEYLEVDPAFTQTARKLAGSTILWARIRGWPGERGVVEVSYNFSTDLRLPWYSPEGLGWRALNVAIELPHAGDSGDFHLEVDFPHSVLVAQAQVNAADGDQGPEGVALPLVTGRHRASAHLSTIGGDRAVAWLRLVAEQSSVRFAFLASLLNTALLIALYIDRVHIVIEGETLAGAATFMAPIGVALLATRGTRGPLAAALLGGVRRLAGLVALLSLISAVTLVLTARRYLFTFDVIWELLIAVSVVTSLMLLASALLPLLRSRRGRWRQHELTPPARYWDVVNGTYHNVDSAVTVSG
jgi:hypothetical protein